MPFVVDASEAACWFMPDERHPIADAAYRRIAHDPAVTPVLWRYELRNMLIVNERRGRLDSAKTARVLRLLIYQSRSTRPWKLTIIFRAFRPV